MNFVVRGNNIKIPEKIATLFEKKLGCKINGRSRVGLRWEYKNVGTIFLKEVKKNNCTIYILPTSANRKWKTLKNLKKILASCGLHRLENEARYRGGHDKRHLYMRNVLWSELKLLAPELVKWVYSFETDKSFSPIPNILEEIKANKHSYKDLPETERKAVIESRIGQGRFRADLIQFWRGCAITKCTALEVLMASHIKPWKDSNNRERLDKYNGLLLVPNLHSAFDKGLITFWDDGSINISSRLNKNNVKKLGIHPKMKMLQIRKEHIKYLKYHRENLFQR